jgi:signal transduction histidine kinase
VAAKRSAQSTPETALARSFKLAVILPTIAGVGIEAWRHSASFTGPPSRLADLFLWTIAVVVVELLPVPVTRVLRLSLSFPILLAVAILYSSPWVVAAVTLVGLFDPREIKREVTVTAALFNRAQAALAFLVGSLVFHSGAQLGTPWYLLLPAVIVATISTYGVNVALVVIYMRLVYGNRLRDVFLQLRVGALTEFLLNYVGLGLVGVVIAKLYAYSGVKMWSVIAFVLPLVFARQMFFRSMALEEAGKELKDRERVLKALSNRLAEERQDERMQIAAYLHDDLAQMLFRLTLQAEMARKRLARGDLEAVGRDLEGIVTTKQQTAEMVRALIRDLHRSPIGRKGLAEAIGSFAVDMTKGLQTKIQTDVVEVSLPPPIQLLIYQIAREAAMNALKHAEANTIWISLLEKNDGVELQIRDDGKGFDTSAPPPEGHFGSVMMKERALVTGGTFKIESEVGQGTTITATFPRVWLEEGSLLESQSDATPAPTMGAEGATTDEQVLSPSGLGKDRGTAPTPEAPPAALRPPEEVRVPATPATRRDALVGLLRRRSA